MQPWSRAPGLAALPGCQAMESMAHAVVTQTSTAGVDKPMGNLAPGQELFTALPVIGQDLDGRWMQRNQTGLAELGGAYRQDAFVEINVVHREAKRFTNAQALCANVGETPYP